MKITDMNWMQVDAYLKRDDRAGAIKHLDAFLVQSPTGPDAERWVEHARQTLVELRSQPDTSTSESGA